MPHKRVIVEITPSMVAVRRVRGTVVVDKREAVLPQSEWGEDWTASEPVVRDAIARAVRELGVTGGLATVVYDIPGASCVVTSAAVNVPITRALESACLTAQSAVEMTDENIVAGAICLSNGRAGGKGQRLCLSCADAESTLARLASMVEAGGLRVESLVPRDACAIVESVGMLEPELARPQVVAWIGRHSMAISIGIDGALRAARATSIGLSAIVDALARPGATDSGRATGECTTPDEAWSLLWRRGIPAPSGGTEGDHEDQHSLLLPQMQPVLQRMAVEIKQSLRFEVEAGVREDALLTIVGPGACCPGLQESLRRFVGLESCGEKPSTSARDAGESGGVLRAPGTELSLLPSSHVDRRVRRRVRVGLALGSTIALALAAQARFDALERARHDRVEMASLVASLEDVRRSREAQDRILHEQSVVQHAMSRLRKSLGDGINVSGVMRVLSDGATSGIRLRSVDVLDQAGAKPQLVISALSPIPSEAESVQSIRSFIAHLEGSPLVASTRLGSAQRVAVEGRDMQSFNVTADLVALPASQRVSTAGGER